MDAGTAAVLGAIVGSIGTIVAGALAIWPSLSAEKRAAKVARQTALGAAVQAVVGHTSHAASPLRGDSVGAKAREARDFSAAITEMAVLIPKGSTTPVLFVWTAKYIIENSEKLASSASAAVAMYLPAWYVGTFDDADLESLRRELIKEGEAEGLVFAPGDGTA